VAQNGSIAGEEDHAIVGQVAASDRDAFPAALGYALVTGPAHGQIDFHADGTFAYTPVPDFNGIDTFTFKASDGDQDSNTATFSLTVREVNDAPTANLDSKTTAEDTPLTFAATTLIANDSVGPANETGQHLTVTGVAATAATHGTVSLLNGQIVYTPEANYNGEASFNYTIVDDGTTDGQSDPRSGLGTVNVTVTPVNDAPIFTSSPNFSIAENKTAIGSVAAVDVEHDAFTFALVGAGDRSFFSVDAHSGLLSFVNTPDFETPEDANHDNVYDLTVSVTDVFGATSTQAIHVKVTDVAEVGKTISGSNGTDVLTGTCGNDTIDSGNGNDLVNGGDGNDRISGGNGDDGLTGGRGNDLLDGGNGNDTLDAGVGNNQLLGGNGNDVMQAADGNNFFDGGNGNDVMTAGNGDNQFIGGNGNDVMHVGNGNNLFLGGNGNDRVVAGNGNNTFVGGNGNDIITMGNGNNVVVGGNGNEIFTAGNGNNLFIGGSGNDTVSVGNGNNSLSGGTGTDTFRVGTGNNTLAGGPGNDKFAFGPGFGKDVITDFNHGDHVEFDGVFADFHALQMVMHQVGQDTVIGLDPQHAVTLQHVSINSLHASDFILV
jgi:Ca2+-binding RTX toxin-like protein